jgi:hypothetical protein
MQQLLLGFIWYALFPVWLLAGLADYLCHRATHIERTSGLRESLLHLLQAVELGVPLLCALLLEITPLVLMIMAVCVLAHTATALWDVAYADPRRDVPPLEQHIHSYLEIIPMVAVALVALMHWDSVMASPNWWDGGPDHGGLRLKRDGPSLTAVAWVLGLVFTFQALPLMEELWRAWRER